jgi:hypothetical protein
MANDDLGAAYEQWQFYDLPFVNELCLMLLLAVWHQVERDVICLAALVTSDGKMISREQFLRNIQKEQECYMSKKTKGQVINKLKLTSFPEWGTSMDTLRLLGNCYKHDPAKEPTTQMMKILNLDASRTYMPLPESEAFRKGLAAYVGLHEDANLVDIAEEFVQRASSFLTDLRTKTGQTGLLSTWGPVNFGDLKFYGI